MSRSPETNQTTRADLKSYEKSWEAIYNLVDEGKSWSGDERNCAFLNTGGGRFADISAAAGLDFEDDGRAVAIADWDFDGRLDFWVTNRTAPRVRLLHNQGGSTNRFVAFRLHGTSCNRDAIGARLELSLAGGGVQIKTLHAGDGYLAQSSKWMHFGLGDGGAIDKLVVRWPGGKAETFEGIAAGRFYQVIQGSGSVEAWRPPGDRVALKESPVAVPQTTATARTWIAGRVLFPAENYESWTGEEQPIASFEGRPLLINLWSRTCTPCVAELADWQSHADSIRGSGVEILALCVDPDPQSKLVADLPFSSGVATEDDVNAFEILHRALLETRKPLPVPCSILLDSDGLVAAIYKGSLTHEQLIADVALLSTTPELQRAAALPFPGLWESLPLPPLPRQVIGTMRKAGLKEAAYAYTRRCLEPGSKMSLDAAVRADLTMFLGDLHLDKGELDQAVSIYARLFELAPEDSKVHRDVGLRLVTKQRVRDAIRHLDKAVALDPSHADARFNLASLQMREGMVAEATVHFREVAKLVPDSVQVHFYLANALHAQSLTKEALVHFRVAHRLQPNLSATNNLAWILATSRDDALRDGAEALVLAAELCQKNGFKDPILLNTLAAAYAGTGKFDDAIKIAEKGLVLANASPAQAAIIKELNANLQLYRAGRPVRE